MSARHIPANPKRMLEGKLANIERDHRTSGPSAGNTWAAMVFKGDPDPKECATCNKRGTHMRLIAVGEIECSHIECPNRKRCTAQPGAKTAGSSS